MATRRLFQVPSEAMLLAREDPLPDLGHVLAQGLLDEPPRLQVALDEAGLELPVTSSPL